jgi:hypothetical protein
MAPPAGQHSLIGMSGFFGRALPAINICPKNLPRCTVSLIFLDAQAGQTACRVLRPYSDHRLQIRQIMTANAASFETGKGWK